MVEISDSVRLLYETSLEKDGDRYVLSIPTELVESGTLSDQELYRVALLGTENKLDDSDQESSTSAWAEPETVSSHQNTQQEPPVEVGETRSVTIDTRGDQGDGIARVERGFIVIVPGTQPGDQVDVEITDVKETVAFAEPVSNPMVR